MTEELKHSSSDVGRPKVVSKKDQVRLAAESDLLTFIRVVHPQRILGKLHEELIRWWYREEAKSHQLVLLPRDHQKSSMVAYRVVWELTKNPSLRILYISATAKLAIKQLKLIKDILTSDTYTFYWPEMVSKDEGKREKWTETEVSVDHPQRKRDMIRDPSIFTAGLTTTITGLHCDIAVLDDIVVDDNAYSEDGREKVRSQVSYLASVAGTDGKQWAVGTRYHPNDQYDDMMNIIVKLYNEDGSIDHSYQLYELYERQVESVGDGTGEYIWPRKKAANGKWYGFNQQVLAEKKAQYHDVTKFRAQYYNNPNDLSQATITPDMFQYFNKEFLNRDSGKWFFKGNRLNVFASIDFAYSLNKKADYTCIVVVGVDTKNNFYVLDIDRFKSPRISDYFEHILRLYQKWDFRKLRAEVTAAQEVIVNDLKENYIRAHGLALAVDPYRPSGREGSKEERMEAILQPKYSNKQIWHYLGGNCEILEEELVMQHPPHDDVKDALSSVIDMAIAPSTQLKQKDKQFQVTSHHRFGGIT